tara:strand:- start:562 stop:1287 length:726 start_codon:yes stop_codon:yes gene_type:complete
MSTPTTQVNTRGGKGTTNPPTDTAKQNYTAQTIGKNEKGSVWIGPIHKQGDVTSAVVLRNEQDRTHQLCLDIDGERPGSTTSTSPGKLQLTCGDNMKEAEDSCLIEARNGNIIIKASNGKIRMEATDIEMVTTGEGETKGNVKITSSENIILNCKKLQTNSSVYTKLCSAGDFETAANGVLSTYASLINSITDAVFGKPSKFGGQKERQKNNLPSASDETVASLDRGAPSQKYVDGTNQLQ